MRLEWTLRGADLARANSIRTRVAEDWESLCEDNRFAQKGNLLIITKSPWDNSDPYLSLEYDALVFDGDRMAFQLHCLGTILEIFDAQTRQECPHPEVFDTFLPHLAWWQVETDAEDFTASTYLAPGFATHLAAA
ncbi:MAG: hypothetical protein FWH15_04320 [Betaproteobacteria bacterium]|nr:hypothetical protein [Betaproteobacteria bacterium]